MYRIVLHVPVGAACALLTRLSNTLAAILAALFVVYELNQRQGGCSAAGTHHQGS